MASRNFVTASPVGVLFNHSIENVIDTKSVMQTESMTIRDGNIY